MSSAQPTHTETNRRDADRQQDSALYSALMAHYLHQNHLLWSRAQLLIALQVAILAVGYSQRGLWLAPAIMLFGALVSILIMILVINDQEYRDMNLPIMAKLADELLPDEIKVELHLEGNVTHIRLRLTTNPKFIHGGYIIEGVLILFIIIDFLLAALYYGTWANYTWASCLFP